MAVAAEHNLCSSGWRIPIQCQTGKAPGGSHRAQLIRAAPPDPRSPQEEPTQRQKEGKGVLFQTHGHEERKDTQFCQDGLRLEKTERATTDTNKVLLFLLSKHIFR